MEVREDALVTVVEEREVVVAGAAEEEAETTKSLMVWKLAIQLDYSPKNNGKICLVGKGVICNRVMSGNEP